MPSSASGRVWSFCLGMILKKIKGKFYENGKDDYYKEIQRRLEHGEMYTQDSIKMPDSLKFKTPNGRIVFGGGGILPDVFV